MMGRLKESRWVYVLVSIALAVIFWMYVREIEDPARTETLHNVRVELTGTSVLTGQGLTVAELSAETVDLTVEAPLSVINNLVRYRSNIYVSLDVSRCAEGETTISCRPVYPDNYFNVDNVVTKGQEPSTITVTVEKLYTKSVPVEFRLDGQVAGSYQMGTPVIEPANVTISGPMEQVNQVAKVAAVLQDEKLDERFAGDLPLTLLDKDGKELSDLEVTLSADTAYVVVPVVMTKEVALTVSVLPGGGAARDDAKIRIEPKTIIVSGAEEDIQGLNEISLGPIDLSDVVGTNTFQFPISLDPSLENVSGTDTATVTVTVDGLSTKVFSVSNISLSGKPSGYDAEIVTQSVMVTVRGKEEDLEKIDGSQIRIVADLSELTAVGTSRVPVRVYLDGSSSVGVIGEYTVTVTLSR